MFDVFTTVPTVTGEGGAPGQVNALRSQIVIGLLVVDKNGSYNLPKICCAMKILFIEAHQQIKSFLQRLLMLFSTIRIIDE